MPRNGPTKTNQKRPKFGDKQKVWIVELLIDTGGSYKDVAKAVGTTVQTILNHRKLDPDFDKACEEAYELSTITLEAAAIERAVHGVVTITADKDGNVIKEETRYSDTLLIFLMKARHPEKYRENVRLEHTGKDGKDLDLLSREQKERFLAEQLADLKNVRSALAGGDRVLIGDKDVTDE